ncbi:TetR/AcrR family transcriptional regulator [Limnohabitans sp.]|uniref:TetR/AcrR family transcriptional regulator n=1 Tax=Limnohabitans sp. TaxID=1907725 RepID=UPI00334098FE
MVKTILDLDLKEACIQAAREVIAEQGIEGLSLRDVSRKLGVSHQAPYRHYPSRDHLLAAIMQRCFEDFATFLNQASKVHTTDALLGMGQAYMRYAAQNPLEYRLMFGTPWPEPAVHPELVRHAVHAFDFLRQHLQLQLQQHAEATQSDMLALLAQAELQALFIWSALHGMASIEQANVMQHLVLSPGVSEMAEPYLMGMMKTALTHGPAQLSQAAPASA